MLDRIARRQDPAAVTAKMRFWSSLPWMVLFYGAPVVLFLAVRFLRASDYVGRDNDDAMRLVQVRDLLNGQGWFDLVQLRLGLDGGTQMHWSRLIDLPIAGLISLLSPLFGADRAEVLALAIWPIFLAIPLLVFMGLAGRRIGGTQCMHFCLGLTAIFVVTSNRFMGGAIDHHNVQLVLAAVMAAMLVDMRHRVRNYVIAGAAAALAIAIGAETTPLVAVVCAIVALQWALLGRDVAGATIAFGISLAVTLSTVFFLTVPPHLYRVATCDNLSIAFYSLALVGGCVLAASAAFVSDRGISARFVALAVSACSVLAVALVIAPQCLGNPLADLDPLLIELWLDRVTEAQSFATVLARQPASVGAYYFCGVFASLVCVWRIWQGDRVRLHLILVALVAANLAIAMVQVRAMAFSNLLAILPLSLLLVDMRAWSQGGTRGVSASLAYVLVLIFSVPAVWAIGGALARNGLAALEAPQASNTENCLTPAALSDLEGLPPSMIVGPSDIGASILRYTSHRVLTAPYHRNADGMFMELKIGLASPSDAKAMLSKLHEPILAFCANDVQADMIIKREPRGLYGQLAAGRVPEFLTPLPVSEKSSILLYALKP
ncbi:hypothetical protein [Ensifer sp. 1H6]|uniref:hypothetical protein n=1 Tax=Ensifer sp. 1H6 TaxID=1911585 RepID=UPI0009CDD0D5|nr:hypothetical protein [Ensifer sp. 1H6]OMQ45010.1 hypothetical protein BKP54_08735 [Ensifer sp. 1H6]